MNNFTFHNPTRLLFGKGMIEKLSTAIPMVHRIMITSRPCEKLSR